MGRFQRWAIGMLVFMTGCATVAERPPSGENGPVVRLQFKNGFLLQHREEGGFPNRHLLLLVQPPGIDPDRSWKNLPPLLASDRRFVSYDIAVPIYSPNTGAGSEGVQPAALELIEFMKTDLKPYGDITVVAHGAGAMASRQAILMVSETASSPVPIRRLLLIDPAVDRVTWERACLISACARRPPSDRDFVALEAAWAAGGFLDLPTVLFRNAKDASEGLGVSPKSAEVVVLPKDQHAITRLSDRNDPWLAQLAAHLPKPAIGERKKSVILVLPFTGDLENQQQNRFYFALEAPLKDSGLRGMIESKKMQRLLEIEGTTDPEQITRKMGELEAASLVIWGRAENGAVTLKIMRLGRPPNPRPDSEFGMPENAPIHAFARIRDEMILPETWTLPPLFSQDFSDLSRFVTAMALQLSGDAQRALAEIGSSEEARKRYPAALSPFIANLLLSTAGYPARAPVANQAISLLEKSIELNTRETAPEPFALSQYVLGRAYWMRAAGVNQEDLGRSAAAYQASLEVWDRSRHPEGYAWIQRGLGDLLTELNIGGSKSNLAKALAAYDQALSVWSFRAHPFEHAATAHAKALAYFLLAQMQEDESERARSLGEARSMLQISLSVFKPETYPAQYATSYYLLGRVYADLPGPDGQKNLENAVGSYRAALAFFSKAEAPAAYASIQTDLGSVYWKLPAGDVANDLRKAVSALEAALAILSPETRPASYAETAQRLGLAYADLPGQLSAETLPKAISAFESALAVFGRQNRRADQARIQVNLAKAYMDRTDGDPASHLKRAIDYLNKASGYFTKTDSPKGYAEIQTKLAMAHWLMPTADLKDSIRETIAHYQEALGVYTQADYPYQHAVALSNMGIAFMELRDGPREENLSNAIKAFEQSLSVVTRKDSPFQYSVIKYNLALAYWHLTELDPKSLNRQLVRSMNNHLRGFLEAFPDAYLAYFEQQGKRFLMTAAGESLPTGPTAVADQLFRLRMKFLDFAHQRPERFRPEILAQLEFGEPLPLKPPSSK